MKYTNRHGLPPQIVSAIVKDRYSSEDDLPSDYSVTTLISPIQQTILRRRFPDKRAIPDVMDLFWSFKGAVGHTVLEDAWNASQKSRIEERLYTEIQGKTISGKFDCYDIENKEIVDFKFTKVYKFIKQDFVEWEKQLNLYAHLLRKAGHEVNKLTIWMFLEDYKENESFKKGYPSNPIVSIDLKLWTEIECCSWLNDRVSELIKAEASDILPECSPREMWQDIKDYAIMKDGASRATKCFDSKEEAEACLEDEPKYKKGYSVQERLTDRKRCAKHCDVSKICRQYQNYLKEKGEWIDPEERVIF